MWRHQYRRTHISRFLSLLDKEKLSTAGKKLFVEKNEVTELGCEVI